jgi:hypothetical protein
VCLILDICGSNIYADDFDMFRLEQYDSERWTICVGRIDAERQKSLRYISSDQFERGRVVFVYTSLILLATGKLYR